jgi:hypothetical protein
MSKVYYQHENSIVSCWWATRDSICSVDEWSRASVTGTDKFFVLQVDGPQDPGYYATKTLKECETYLDMIASGTDIVQPNAYSYDLLSERSCHSIEVIADLLFTS